MDQLFSDIQSTIKKKELFEPLKDSRVFVTGATGLIGSVLVKTLIAASEAYSLNIKVTGQIRNEAKAKAVFGALAEKFALSLSDDVPCDHIIHTVSPTTSKFFIEHPVETIRTSVESAVSALETARKNKAAMVYLSSMEQYGVPYKDGEIMTEDTAGAIDHLNVRSSYSESKRLCECLCASYASEYGINVKIARLAQTFGAGVSQGDNRMPVQFARSVAEGKDIVLHTEGNSITNFVYLTDAVSGILTILLHGAAGEAYNVCNDTETRSAKEAAEIAAGSAGGGGRVVIEKKENMGYAPDVNMYLNSDKLRALGWMAEVSMKEAYGRLIRYLKESGS